ncbi:hypothetical protein [Flavobacterium hydrophilum]|uniref:hypothetical protein n=1 Tax=Flavobacterium hydrophilum TaxID=2211445 RepID=UPI001E452EAB|nr:hypothetical protein [Flavobacterium hydrophilum]
MACTPGLVPGWQSNCCVQQIKRQCPTIVLDWSSFDEELLSNEDSFKAAEFRYTAVGQINPENINHWLQKAREIQWDCKNIVKRKGVLLRLK